MASRAWDLAERVVVTPVHLGRSAVLPLGCSPPALSVLVGGVAVPLALPSSFCACAPWLLNFSKAFSIMPAV